MPTYDYRCNTCEHEFELFQSMKDAPKRKCPKCGKNTLERLIGTGAAVLFKGSGFYETDYRTKSYRDAAKADKPNSSSTSTETKSSETKPAEKKTETTSKKTTSETTKPAKSK
ncbi:MAG: zinc ribbon domain-containing protein [Phycisphaeraceae bacterium]|nr:zinc ribbon domain-containing protein [Phycisphaerales bacterium]MCB9861478.1 zinc ribbon domain-containing protein [Phycisphaeraceae bacterium]